MSWVPDGVGWAATAIFAASYFCREGATIRKVQAAAATAWVGYGLLVHSLPVVFANLIVVSLALYTGCRKPRVESGHPRKEPQLADPLRFRPAKTRER